MKRLKYQRNHKKIKKNWEKLNNGFGPSPNVKRQSMKNARYFLFYIVKNK